MIRRMEHNDLDPIVQIWLDGNCSAHHFVPMGYWESHLDYMRKVLPQAEVWVYCIDKQIVAFLGLDSNYIAGLFVTEEFQSQGIGHALLDHAKSLYDVLSLCVYEKNQRAVKFYTREGFEVKDYHIDNPTDETEIAMQWSI